MRRDPQARDRLSLDRGGRGPETHDGGFPLRSRAAAEKSVLLPVAGSGAPAGGRLPQTVRGGIRKPHLFSGDLRSGTLQVSASGRTQERLRFSGVDAAPRWQGGLPHARDRVSAGAGPVADRGGKSGSPCVLSDEGVLREQDPVRVPSHHARERRLHAGTSGG